MDERSTIWLAPPQDAQLEVAALWEPSLLWEAPAWLQGPAQAGDHAPVAVLAPGGAQQPAASSSSSSSCSGSEEDSDDDTNVDVNNSGSELQVEQDQDAHERRGGTAVAAMTLPASQPAACLEPGAEDVISDGGGEAKMAATSGDDTSSSDSGDAARGPTKPAVVGRGGGLWRADTASTDLFSQLDDVLAVAGGGFRRNALQLLQRKGNLGVGGNPRAGPVARAPDVFRDPAAGSNPVHVREPMTHRGALNPT